MTTTDVIFSSTRRQLHRVICIGIRQAFRHHLENQLSNAERIRVPGSLA
jgi:hypothetical protein